MSFLSIQDIQNIEKSIGYSFKNQVLLEKAFTHSSFANLHDRESNERLEFFGDSILSFIVSEKLYDNSKRDEGQLSHIRSQLVSAQSLSKIIDNLNLTEIYGKYALCDMTVNVKGDLFESLLGAIYIDGGLEAAREFVLNNIDLSEQAIVNENKKIVDYKSPLQEYLQGKGIVEFEYKTLAQTGQAHNPDFEIGFFVKGEQVCSAHAGSKQKAEQMCAKIALDLIKDKKTNLDNKDKKI